MHSVNGAQFSSIYSLFLSSTCIAADNCASFLRAFGSGSCPTSPAIVFLSLTSIYGSI